jgi:hypothetical protein
MTAKDIEKERQEMQAQWRAQQASKVGVWPEASGWSCRLHMPWQELAVIFTKAQSVCANVALRLGLS